MSITTLSSRQFNQDTSGAKNASAKGPVIITDRGRPAHVLLTFTEYRKLTTTQHAVNIADLLAINANDAASFDFLPATSRDVAQAADFS